MSSTDKKWQDKFDDGDLDNLDWLEVGPQVLENIEDRIYPPKKKNNILFFLIGAGLLLSIGGLFTLLNESTTQDHLSAEVTTKTERSRSVATTEINTPEREREPYVEQMTEYTTDITTESENSITTTDATNDRAEKNAVTDKNIVADITSPIILEDNSLILHESKKNVTKFNSPPPPTSQKQAGNAHDFQK